MWRHQRKEGKLKGLKMAALNKSSGNDGVTMTLQVVQGDEMVVVPKTFKKITSNPKPNPLSLILTRLSVRRCRGGGLAS